MNPTECVEAVIDAATVDMDPARAALATLLEADDPRLERLDEIERRVG